MKVHETLTALALIVLFLYTSAIFKNLKIFFLFFGIRVEGKQILAEK